VDPTANEAGITPGLPTSKYIDLVLIDTPTNNSHPHKIHAGTRCNVIHPDPLPTFKHELSTILHYYTIYCSRMLSAHRKAAFPCPACPHSAQHARISARTRGHGKATRKNIDTSYPSDPRKPSTEQSLHRAQVEAKLCAM
jgi:hypothetical protein